MPKAQALVPTTNTDPEYLRGKPLQTAIHAFGRMGTIEGGALGESGIDVYLVPKSEYPPELAFMAEQDEVKLVRFEANLIPYVGV